MSKPINLVVIHALIILLLTHTITLSLAAGDHHIGWIPATQDSDLEIDDMEFTMDSEINRRILATNRRYISYGALSKNNVPCSRRGASYYNCRSGGQANPYTRGCSAITRCRR